MADDDNQEPTLTEDQIAALRTRADAGDTAAAALEKQGEALAAAQETATTASVALLEQTRTANPTIPPALISGDTPSAIAESLTSAHATVAAVIDANKTEEGPKVPAGAPARKPANEPPEGVRGIALIAHALNNPGPGSTTE